jgi:hypothetical protein
VRKIFLPIFFLVTSISFAQSDEKVIDPFAIVPIEFGRPTTQDIGDVVSDSTNYVELRRGLLIYGREYRDAYVACMHYGKWYSFPLLYDPNSVRHEFTDIDSDKVDELVIYGSRSDYGSGGGTSASGVTIYKIDTAVTRLFDLVYSFSEESFGREGPGYVHTCERTVTVGYNQVSISPITTKKHKRKGGMEYEDICGSIDDIKPGIYSWQNGRLAWKANYRK